MFLLIPVVNGVSSLLALPAVTAAHGAAGWAAIAIGFATGAGAAILVEAGWGVDGPMHVARAGTRARKLYYAWSARLRLAVFGPSALLAGLVAWLVSTEYKFEAGVMAVAVAAVGLSPAWYFTGTGQPGWVLFTDGAPRLVATGASVVGLLAGAPLAVYPLLLGAGNLATLWLGARFAGLGPMLRPRLGRQRALRLAIIQGTALRGRIGSGLFKALPVTLVGIVAPGSVPVFAAAERLQKMALQFLNSVSLFLTSWVGEARTRELRIARANKAILVSGGVGLAAAIAFAALGPAVSHIIFQGAATVPAALGATAAVVVLLATISRSLVIKLIVLRRVATYSNAANVGGVVGAGAILWLGHVAGSLGAMIGEIVAECATLAYQMLGLRRYGSPRGDGAQPRLGSALETSQPPDEVNP